MTRILITNDDGVYSEGLRLLARALAPLAEVTVVAPDREQSATGHSLTLNRPLRLQKIEENWYAVDGTPTDCVNLAVLWLLKDRKPDLVVSGINLGLNLGDDVTYSGTVAGALEAALLGIPGIAVSQQRTLDTYDFSAAALAGAQVAALVLQNGLTPRTSLNINVPSVQSKGMRATFQAKRNHVTVVSPRMDPRDKPYYWIEEGEDSWEPHDRSDYQAVKDGYVSVTPLQPDLTAYDELEALGRLLG